MRKVFNYERKIALKKRSKNANVTVNIELMAN